jgi:hypothetical protein
MRYTLAKHKMKGQLHALAALLKEKKATEPIGLLWKKNIFFVCANNRN